MADESGVALITALLAVMLMSALMVGMFAALATDQRSHAVDRDQTQAYAAAHAGLEKLTSNLASLFVTDVSPSVAQINAVALTPPVIPGYAFTAPGGAAGSGYAITYPVDGGGNPQASPMDITTGPFTGFKGIITPYTVTITAVSPGGAEVRLRRDLQTVAVPVFQFGVFSDSDLSIYAGGGFNFGGRVHTNGSLFVGAQTGADITFNDRITAVREVVHNYLSNGLSSVTSVPSFTNNVFIPTSPSTNRNLKQSPNEGSVAGMPGSAANPNWTTISTGTYKSYLRTGLTGAKRLDLPLVSQGATPVDLIRRPALNSNENVVNAAVFGQRYFAQASLRILLSDRVADITGLPTVTGTAPVQLDGDWIAAPPGGVGGYGPVDNTHPPIARSMGPGGVATVAGSPYVAGTGFSQIRVTDAAGSIPAQMKVQNLILNNALNGDQAVTCTGKTSTQFTGCNTPVAYLAGATIRATLPSGVTVTRNVTANVAINGNITVAANDTAPFSVNLFWMNNPNQTVAGTAVPVTCQGYSDVSPRQFINCSGLTAAPAAGLWLSTSALANQNTGTIGGFLKVEKQDTNGVWSDVTMEILNLGIGAPNSGGTLCNDPTPDAVIRIQRLHDNGPGSVCTYNNSQDSWDWWPNTLYDAREGSVRDTATTAPMNMGGVMQYIALDANNLKRWFSGATGATGNAALNNNGYIVYFSDRRGDHDENNADVETGEYGFEDLVNSTTGAGTPDGILQAGEDVNGNGTQQLYGGTPWNDAANLPAGNAAPYSAAGTPRTAIPIGNAAGGATIGAGIARVNKVVLFRRALKVINGGIVGGVNSLPATGLTIAAENPVYVQGNYNATSDPAAEPNVPASIIGDAITLLSNAWTDSLSFVVPNSATTRNAISTGYRFGAVAGKGLSFTYCGAACGNPGQLYGTDGGAANFLRLMEDWGAAGGLNYRGSLITLHINRQATGTYKFISTHVYNGGARNFSFDIDFLTPSLLPPGTPMFRDINTLKFRQILRPNQ